MTVRQNLEALADRLGIAPAYRDLAGTERRASDATREALVSAMGHDASSEEAAERSLAAIAALEAERLLEPVQVWRECAHGRPRVGLRVGRGGATGLLELHCEGGHVVAAPLAIVASGAGRSSVELPVRPAQGYHRVRVELDDGRCGEQRLIVTPRTAPTVTERLGGRRAFGVAANLYSVRGEGGFGCGDMGHLEQLLALVGEWGGDFVGLNPLHALRNRGESISPYSPVSRLWRNLLYLDLEQVPEFGRCEAAHELLKLDALARSVDDLRAAERLDYEALLELKLGLLRELHGTFRHGEEQGPTDRGRAYERFVVEGGVALRDHATFEALGERFTEQPDWRRWPERYRDPRSPALEALRQEDAACFDLHRWIQFELEAQLARAAETGRAAGLEVGLLNDLAVGSPPDSGDAWANPGLLARGVSMGAPPDAFAADGQDWGLSPIDPNSLREDGYRLWTRLLRASFRHAGGLRIDHAIGLVRSFWIPEGQHSSEGAYVRQRADDLLGILALEARRADALVVGEDLGVVPAGLKRRLASWGLLSTSVLLFERDGREFRAPEHYSPRTLVTATTHDLVPLPGYLEGADLRLRAQLEGDDSEALVGALEERRLDVEGLERRLDQAGVPAHPGEPVGVGRVHHFLAGTPAPLLALSLDDLAEEHEPINLPGISTARYRSWSRRMSRPLREIQLEAGTLVERSRPVGTGSCGERAQDGAR